MLKEFVNSTSDQSVTGTRLNRKNLMAIQGFIAATTVFNNDGSVTQTNGDGEKLYTTFNDDGSITEKFVGKYTMTKTTKFLENGNVEETVS